jgi:RNA polymerase sigma factor (sigma-70 family)
MARDYWKEWDYWYSRVYAYFFRRVNSSYEVEELTARTLNDYFLTQEEVRSDKALMWRIARCKLLDFIKTKKPAHLELNEHYQNQPEPGFSNFYKEKVIAIQDCLRRNLNQKEYQIIEMCVMYDFSSKDAAAELGIKPDNLRQILSRSLKKVRKICLDKWLN